MKICLFSVLVLSFLASLFADEFQFDIEHAKEEFLKESLSLLQELEDDGLGPKHPRVIVLKSFVADLQDGDVNNQDPRRFMLYLRYPAFRKYLYPNLENLEPNIKEEKHAITKKYYLFPDELTKRKNNVDMEIAESQIENIYKFFLHPEVRKYVISLHPIEDGVLIEMHSNLWFDQFDRPAFFREKNQCKVYCL